MSLPESQQTTRQLFQAMIEEDDDARRAVLRAGYVAAVRLENLEAA